MTQQHTDAAHYPVYDDVADVGELYDHIAGYRERPDVPFYVDVARGAAGPVVELGCGTGRVLLPIARAGVHITGLDRSQRMLARCRESVEAEPPEVRNRVTLEAGDVRSFNLDRKFAMALLPFRVLQHFVSVEDQLACLSAARRHLVAGGFLVLDVFHPLLSRLVSPSFDEMDDTPDTPLPNGRRLRRTARLAAVHLAAQVSDIELIYYVTESDGRVDRRVQAFPMRWYLRFELEHLLARSGFSVHEIFGNFDRSPFADGSPEIVVIAEKR